MQNSGINYIIKALPRLLGGLELTLQIAFISLLLSVVFGLIVGIILTSRNKVIAIVFKILLEAFRLIHPLIWLFVFFFGASYIFKIETDGVVSSIIAFTLWGTFETGDLVRGYIKSLPTSQTEASSALGLSKLQTYTYILMPQIIIRVTPSIVNLATRLIKTTSLVFIIGVPEVLQVSQSVIQVAYNQNPNSYISLTMYGFLLIIYFVACYPLSLFSKYLERRVEKIF